jgi:hypothetical protein
MTISAKKKFAIALSTLSLSLTITSCGAGLNAPTSKIRQVTDGAEADAGAIKVRHIMVVAQADGSGTLVGSIVNSAGEPDAIEVIGINYQVATYAGKKNLDVNSPVNFATSLSRFDSLKLAQLKLMRSFANVLVNLPMLVASSSLQQRAPHLAQRSNYFLP